MRCFMFLLSAFLGTGCGNSSTGGALPDAPSGGTDAPGGGSDAPVGVDAEPPSSAGMIVFAAALDGQAAPDLYRVNSDGTRLVRLTFTAGAELVPSWSPDHTQIAFVRDFQLFAIDADGGEERLIAERTGRERKINNTVYSTTIGPAAWSPDGTRLAYPYPRPPNLIEMDTDIVDQSAATMIHLVNADGTGDQALANDPGFTINSIGWAPDGNTLSFSQTDDCPDCAGGGWYALIAIDGSDYRQLPPNELVDSDPNKHLDWSADGTRWTYLGGNDYFRYDALEYIYTSAAGATSGVQLVDQLAWNPRWSADGTAVAYLAADGVYVVGADGSVPQRIVTSTDLHGLDW